MAFISIKDTHKVLLLDETFKNLSIDYHDACANMIQTLSKKLGMQIILVSHIQGIIASADKTFRLKRK
jgi:ABC-type Mn2+/Zn2+ transport system ATPase subunit